MGKSIKKDRSKKRKISSVNSDINVKHHITNKIKTLQTAYLTYDGWRSIINDRDACNLCSPRDIFVIQQKARYLAVTLSLSLKMWNQYTFTHICQTAIESIRNIDYHNGEYELDRHEIEIENNKEDDNNPQQLFSIRNPRTITRWHHTF